jgi:hypothetical protein
MAIRNSKLGGTDFSNGEVLYDYDLDDTNNVILNSIGNVQAELTYKGQGSTTWSNGNSTAAEKYSSTSGLQSTVSASNGAFSGDSYTLPIDNQASTDTLNNSNFTSPTLAFDSNDATYAYQSLSGVSSLVNSSLGTTFASKYVKAVEVKYHFDWSSGSPYTDNISVNLETYDGTTWTSVYTLYSNTAVPSEFSLDLHEIVTVNSTVEGVRISISHPSFSSGGARNHNERLYLLSYGDYDLTGDITSNTNTLPVDASTKAFALHWDGTFPTNTSGSFDLISGGTTINLPVDSVTKKTGMVSKGALGNITNLTIKPKLVTTDVTVTPTINGWGIYKQ